MKRKTIGLAGKTLIMTLPAGWVGRCGIRKGDDLQVYETGKNLTVSPDSVDQSMEYSSDISSLQKALPSYIRAVYQAGFDGVAITFRDLIQLGRIEKILSRLCNGFEIMEEGHSRLVARSISRNDAKNLSAVLRRLFLSVILMAETGHGSGKEKTPLPRRVASCYRRIARLADHCRRILSRDHSLSAQSTINLHAVVSCMDRVSLYYRRYFEGSSEQPEKLIKAYEASKKLLRSIYELFYKFEPVKCEEIRRLRMAISRYLTSPELTVSGASIIAVLCIWSISEELWYAFFSIVALHAISQCYGEMPSILGSVEGGVTLAEK
ncbi:TPA: AbrB/MazE/SpoVT family DNA-binding domain-containing protein [Candidatus Woesearchaeota archaeon]|nr:AbrB/MazE/SpoVT family DNA-binding domain-containing protein [Candidatus Woesearchaeota archaeon]